MATSGDLKLATSGDFYMATDSAHPVGATRQNNENLAWWTSPTRRPPPLMRLPKEM
jgi:hypothetical protein